MNNRLNHKSGIIYSSISDHYPIFVSLINENNEFQDKSKVISYRLIDNFRTHKFKSAPTNLFNNSIKHINIASEALSKFFSFLTICTISIFLY